jgi:hypothetical protein
MNGECRYDGWFREGKKWGWGHAQFQSVRYNGYFSRDMPHGTLTESLLIDGRWYECEAKYQQGKLVWRTPLPVAASSNAGDFLAVQIQRKKLFFGIESQRNFNVVFQGDRRWYIGETEDGEIEGLGIESVEREDGTCELYAGQFCQGVRRGHGIVLRGVGDFYVGDFDDGLPHGAGFDLSHDRYYAGEMQVSAICMLPASKVSSESAVHDSVASLTDLETCRRTMAPTASVLFRFFTRKLFASCGFPRY